MLIRLTDEEAQVLVAQRGELNAPWARKFTRGWFADEREVTNWRTARFVSLPAASQNTSEGDK